MNEPTLHALETALQQHTPPAVERDRDDLGAEPVQGGELDRGSMIGDDRGERNVSLAGAVGESESHIAGARGVNALLQRVRLDAADRVPRTSDFERADRLQRFQLEPDLPGAVIR